MLRSVLYLDKKKEEEVGRGYQAHSFPTHYQNQDEEMMGCNL